MNTFSYVFLGFVLTGIAIEMWLALRQARFVRANADAVPTAFSDRISLADHRRAAAYTLEQLKLSRLELPLGGLLLLLWTLGGGVALFDAFWANLGLTAVSQGVALIFSVMFASTLLGLPLSLWRTFVVEERFGFNRTTPKRYLLDFLLQTAVALALGVPLLFILLWLMGTAGSLWWLYAWLVWTGFTLTVTWAYPAWIAPIFNKFTPLTNERLKTRLEALLTRCGFRSQGMFVMDGSRRSSHGNAYFTGFGRSKRIVFFDTLLEGLEDEEVEAVLAHELGHFKKRHITKRLVATTALALAGLGLLGWLATQPWFYLGLGAERQTPALALLLFILTVPAFTFFAAPGAAWLSRKHEFEADDFAAEQTDARHLIGGLVKMYRDNASTLTPDPLYSAFYHSHPPATVRIGNLSHKLSTSPAS